jgi:hypothetical protein
VDSNEDRSTTFDGVKVGRPATAALTDAGYTSLADLPDDLDVLAQLHGVGPSAVKKLDAARNQARKGAEPER